MTHSKTTIIRLAILLPALVCLALPAQAARKKAPPVNVGTGLIGNTVVLTGPTGTTQIFYKDRNNLVIKLPNGKTKRGWWRVKGRSICTKTEDVENCTVAVDVPPVAGASGSIPGPDATTPPLTWEVREGRAFK
ncbi:MAG: hypothetical protein ACOH12_00625 [Parvibaculaceae bacterium]